jgi:predicted RNA binding protein YcfA (HicA-like mRNA interferase family)
LWRLPANARELQRVATKLGFLLDRQRGSHAVWLHRDGRGATIPIHGNRDIAGGLYHLILKQLGVTEEQFRTLR